MTAQIFSPENRLKQKVGSASADEKLQMLADMDANLDRFTGQTNPLLQDWLTEIHATLHEMPRDWHKPVYARAHDLRCMAGSFGQDELGQVANSLCRYLDQCNEPAQLDLRLVRAHINAMTCMAQGKATDCNQALAVVDSLRDAVQKCASCTP